MRVVLILMLVGLAAAAIPEADRQDVSIVDPQGERSTSRNIVINMLIRQLIALVRKTIYDGSVILNTPPLDPLELDFYHLVIPAGIVNIDMKLQNLLVRGIGGFVVNRSSFSVRDLSFDLDVSVPRIDVSSDLYDLSGDFFTALPMYGKGKADFLVEDFRFRAKIFFKQSDDGKSMIIDKIEDFSFDLPVFKSNIEGAMGGGDIDHIINAMIEDVFVGYINRFKGVISHLTARASIGLINPTLEKFPSWAFIEPFV